jgi:hypothetical protein
VKQQQMLILNVLQVSSGFPSNEARKTRKSFKQNSNQVGKSTNLFGGNKNLINLCYADKSVPRFIASPNGT